MKIAILSRLQNQVERGAEVFVNELSKRLSINHIVDILAGKDADSISKVLNGKYDIVIPVNGRLQSLKVSLLKIIVGYKVLITGHSGKGWDDIWNVALVKPDIFIALTESTVAWARQFAWGAFGHWRTRVVKISNGIDLKKFSPVGSRIEIGLKRPIILCVGALVWYKYHDRVIKAVAELKQGSLLIVGEGELKRELEEKGKKILGNRFKISSFRNEDMPKVYRSVDLFTLPSWDREAFGIVYLEALASGVGVVAPDDASRREIVGEGGILTNVEDITNYAQVLEKALKIDWLKKARKQAEKFSWDRIAKDYENVMIEMLKND